MKIIKSHNIYTEDGILDGFLVMEKQKIVMLTSDESHLPKATIIDYSDYMVIPGIIDVHSHGYRTFAARSLYTDEVLGLARILPSIGVTATLPTVCGWQERHLEMLSAAADAVLQQTTGARLLGIHTEGPFFHPTRHNATPLQELKQPSIAFCEAYMKAMKGTWKYMTMAPELPNAFEVITWLKKHDVIVGGGHTVGDEAIFKKAKALGMNVSIHTGNAMNQMDRRDIGYMGSALLDPDVYCEIICDLVHLSQEMLMIMFRMKQNIHRFLMISDSDTVSGVAPGYYLVGNQRTRITDDGRMLLDDGTIAGSCRNVLYGIRNLVEVLHMPLPDVLKMSGENPARILGLEKQKGTLLVGKDADVVVLNNQYQVIETFVEGVSMYRQGDILIENLKFHEEVPIIIESEERV